MRLTIGVKKNDNIQEKIYKVNGLVRHTSFLLLLYRFHLSSQHFFNFSSPPSLNQFMKIPRVWKNCLNSSVFLNLA